MVRSMISGIVTTPYEAVAFGYNKGIITDLLRGELGFDGIVCTDWGLVTDAIILGQPMPARAWELSIWMSCPGSR